MSDRRRSDRPLPPAPHPENGDSLPGNGADPDDNQPSNEILMAPPESA